MTEPTASEGSVTKQRRKLDDIDPVVFRKRFKDLAVKEALDKITPAELLELEALTIMRREMI